MKKVLVCGAGGFIGTHLVRRLKKEGYWVRGVDIKKPDFSKTEADEFNLLDLRIKVNCQKALKVTGGFEEVYQLAADCGGVAYMLSLDSQMMYNNALINTYMIDEAVKSNVKRYFYSSSDYVYKTTVSDKIQDESESEYYPVNGYGWEKLYSEQLILTYSKKHDIKVRIARFHTTFGPEGIWEGLKTKAVDDLCRKTAMIPDEGYIEVWGDGKTARCFTYIEDLINGIRTLMKSNIETPTNLGSNEYVEVNKLAEYVILASGKNLKIKHIDGAVGVHARNFSDKLIRSTGWKAKWKLKDAIKIHYDWVKTQVDKKYPNLQN